MLTTQFPIPVNFKTLHYSFIKHFSVVLKYKGGLQKYLQVMGRESGFKGKSKNG